MITCGFAAIAVRSGSPDRHGFNKITQGGYASDQRKARHREPF
jgi:hypothetical protein